MAHGVIGNTTDFGSVIPGSSPGGPTEKPRLFWTGFFNVVVSMSKSLTYGLLVCAERAELPKAVQAPDSNVKKVIFMPSEAFFNTSEGVPHTCRLSSEIAAS